MSRDSRLLTGLMPLIVVNCLLLACRHAPASEILKTGLPKETTYNPYQVRLDPVFEIHSISTQFPFEPDELKVSLIPGDHVYTEKHGRIEPQPDTKHVWEKISPVLQKWLSEMDDDEIVDILITFKEDLNIPPLPELADHESREDRETGRAGAIRKLKRTRDLSQARSLALLRRYGEFERLESFWIVNSFVARLEIGQIKALANAEFVTYLQPGRGGEKPPSDPLPDNDVVVGRDLIVSDPYFNLGLTTPWLGLLDTGVRDSHQMLADPDVIDRFRDCVNGGILCDDSTMPGYDPSDFTWHHGTGTAAILSGSSQLGMQYRGVSGILIDSWQIYTSLDLDTAAAIRAIQAAIAAFDRVLVGELQAEESEIGAIATAADNAYETGVIFVAANGNYGPSSGTVRSPAIAHKVIGVGGFKIIDGAQYVNQGRGPATDGRVKPDIQAPTESETASGVNDTALAVFPATSGATPYAAATAMLANNWLRLAGTFDNGQTYAFLILYGQNQWPYDNTVGAGPLKMAVNGTAWWGKVVLTHHLNIDIPINVTADKKDFDVALWWPESSSQDHNNIDIYLVDPSGVERAKGHSIESVFERAGFSGSLTPGGWVIRMRGENVPAPTQTVYWAAHIRNE